VAWCILGGMSLVSAILFLLADWLIVLLFGEAFQEAGVVFRWSMIGVVGFSMMSFYQAILYAEDHSWRVTAAPIVMVISLVCVMLLLTSTDVGGAKAAALACSIGNVVAMMVSGGLVWAKGRRA